MKKITLFLSAMLFSVMSFAGVVTFDADADKGNAGTDSNNAAAYQITKDGVTIEVSSGILGTYNNEMHYRIYKNQTLKITSTVGNITKVEFTCTANGEAKYGPGCFTVSTGSYTNDGGAVGTWTGSTAEIVFTASLNQVRASQIVVTIDGEGGGENPGGETPETEVDVTDLDYAMAFYEEEEGFAYWEIQLFNLNAAGDDIEFPLTLVGVEAKSKTSLNGTYDMIVAVYGTGEDAEGYIEGVYMSEDATGTLTIKNVDNEGTYSFVGSFVGEDGKTYKLNTESFMMWVEDGLTGEEIELNEDGNTPGDNPGDNPGDDPITPPADGVVTFDADVDKGNASEDSSNQTPYTVSKGGVTLDVTKGIIGKYNDECHYRVYQNESLTITSTVGNIVSVEFTCTANDDAKYGPGNFAVDGGSYTYSGPVGTWTGDAASVVFTASTAQVRASQIVVTIAEGDTGVEDILVENTPVKVVEKGQLMIICGESVYNVLGVQVK